jgi:hypothetical protein
MLLADYQSYIDCQDRVSLAYKNQEVIGGLSVQPAFCFVSGHDFSRAAISQRIIGLQPLLSFFIAKYL